MERVEIKGIEFLNDLNKREVSRIVEKNLEKIKRLINNDFYLRLSIKEYNKNPEKPDKKKRFSVSVEVSGEIPKIGANAEDWDLNKSLNMVFNKILLEIEHKFHVSDKH